MNVKITTDEWLAELERLHSESPEKAGLSAHEISQHLGIGQETAVRHLRVAIESGKWRYMGKVKRPDITGRMNFVPVYAPIEKHESENIE